MYFSMLTLCIAPNNWYYLIFNITTISRIVHQQWEEWNIANNGKYFLSSLSYKVGEFFASIFMKVR